MGAELVVAYPQSTSCNQYRANAIAPSALRRRANSGICGGFSPGRTFGPVVGTVGGTELTAEEVGSRVGVEVGVREIAGVLEVRVGAGELPPLHPATRAAISAIGISHR